MNVRPANEESARCVHIKDVEKKAHPPDDKSTDSVEEVYFGTMTDSSWFDRAKVEEIQKWRDFKTFVEDYYILIFVKLRVAFLYDHRIAQTFSDFALTRKRVISC